MFVISWVYILMLIFDMTCLGRAHLRSVLVLFYEMIMSIIRNPAFAYGNIFSSEP